MFLKLQRRTNGCHEQAHVVVGPRETMAARSNGKQLNATDIRSQRQALLKGKSVKGIDWEGRRLDPGSHAAGTRGPSATGSRRRVTTITRSESSPADEDVSLLLDTLEELSEAQATLCSQLVTLAASRS
jgi:hypothetical protein